MFTEYASAQLKGFGLSGNLTHRFTLYDLYLASDLLLTSFKFSVDRDSLALCYNRLHEALLKLEILHAG